MGAVSTGPPGIESRPKTTEQTLKIETDLKLKPVSAEPQLKPTPQGHYFTLDLRSNEILIESIQVYTTDPSIGFRFSLFSTRPPDPIIEWDNEDLIQNHMMQQRVYTYYSEKPRYYWDYDEAHKLHAGLIIGQRAGPVGTDIVNTFGWQS